MTFQITFLPDGRSFTALENETVLAVALRNGLNLPYGCRNGACGSCKGKLVEGDVRYLNADLTGITPLEQAAGTILFCQARPCSNITVQHREMQSSSAPAIRKLPCRVMKIEKLNHDVLRLFLKLPSTEGMGFLPGQYIDILMQNNTRRSFSLANAPHADEFLELHVRHYDGGVFSEYAFNSLQEKTLLRIEGPLGSFTLNNQSTRPIIMVAGGTGFAPVKSIIEHMIHHNIKRDVYLYWGARSRRDLYLHDLVTGWTHANSAIHYVPVLSEPETAEQWPGQTGFVHDAVLNDFADLAQYEVYACGPPPMVHAVRDTFIDRGLPEDLIFSDSFEFAPRK